MGTNPADPAIIVAKILALFIGLELAQVIAPHLLVIVAGVLGGVFGLMEWRRCTWWEAIGYVLSMTAVAWLFAGTASATLAPYIGLDVQAVPVTLSAMAIAWIGHRWPSVGRWLLGIVRTLIEQRAANGGKRPDQ